MTVEEASGSPVELWPEHVHAVNAFVAMATQWRRAGMNAAPTGLEYAALPAVLRLVGIPRAEWTQVFDDLRVMEEAALEVLNAKT